MCATEGGEKGVTKDRKGMLITENYKNVHSGHGHGVSWEKPHEQNRKIKTHPPSQPRSASQATHSTLLPRNSVTEGAFTLVDRMTSAARPKLKTETVFGRDQSASVSIRLK
jgi:hypothetical protein